MSAPRLQVRGLAWAIDDRYVIRGLDLTLHAGECVAVTGENGAGKSSLISLLTGARTPRAGSVQLDGVPLDDVDPGHLATRLAHVGHRPSLYLDLSARENLALFRALVGGHGRPDDALDAMGILPADRDRPVRGFSRGMQQRTALGRLIVSPADVWLLDEPSTGLDERGRSLLVDLVRSGVAHGVACLLVSHDLTEIARIGARHMQLTRGRLVTQGARDAE